MCGRRRAGGGESFRIEFVDDVDRERNVAICGLDGTARPVKVRSLAKGFYSFTAARYDNSAKPPATNSKRSIRKLLQAPLSSDCISTRCTKLSECVESDTGSSPIDIHPFRVDSYVTQFVPAAKDYIGRDLIQVSFRFECGLGVNLVFTRDSVRQRVISIERRQ